MEGLYHVSASSSAQADDPVAAAVSMELERLGLLDAPLSRGMTSQVIGAAAV
jgi:hypothetical protein